MTRKEISVKPTLDLELDRAPIVRDTGATEDVEEVTKAAAEMDGLQEDSTIETNSLGRRASQKYESPSPSRLSRKTYVQSLLTLARRSSGSLTWRRKRPW